MNIRLVVIAFIVLNILTLIKSDKFIPTKEWKKIEEGKILK